MVVTYSLRSNDSGRRFIVSRWYKKSDTGIWERLLILIDDRGSICFQLFNPNGRDLFSRKRDWSGSMIFVGCRHHFSLIYLNKAKTNRI